MRPKYIQWRPLWCLLKSRRSRLFMILFEINVLIIIPPVCNFFCTYRYSSIRHTNVHGHTSKVRYEWKATQKIGSLYQTSRYLQSILYLYKPTIPPESTLHLLESLNFFLFVPFRYLKNANIYVTTRNLHSSGESKCLKLLTSRLVPNRSFEFLPYHSLKLFLLMKNTSYKKFHKSKSKPF